MSSPEIDLLAKPLFEAGVEIVYATECCGTVFVGRFKPKSCRSCGSKALKVTELRRDLAIDNS